MATKPRHLKTPLQLWVADNRKRAGLTPADLARLTGVTEDTARGWESRGKPSEDAMAVLERTFGQPAPRDQAATAVGGDVATAIREQTAVLRELVSELQAMRGEQAGVAEAQMSALAMIARSLGDRLPEGTGAADEQRSPAGSGR